LAGNCGFGEEINHYLNTDLNQYLKKEKNGDLGIKNYEVRDKIYGVASLLKKKPKGFLFLNF
jgi:hypothetical protein